MEYTTVTRQEVEEELDRRWASIAGSISRIKSEFSLPSDPIRSAIKSHPLEVMLGTVAAGFALGWAIGGKRRRRKKAAERTESAGGDLGAPGFLNFVRAGRASGLSEEEAVSRALAATSSVPVQRAAPARSSLTDRLTDHVVDMAESMIKAAMRVAAREAAGWIAEVVRRDRSKASE